MIENSESGAAAGLPVSYIGIAPLIRRAFSGEDLVPLAQELSAYAQQNPLDANAYMNFSIALLLTGHAQEAAAVQAEAIAMQAHYALPAKPGHGPGLRLLVLMGPGDFMANTPVEFLVEGSDVSLELLYLTETAEFPATLPEHDVMMVAIGESNSSQRLLARVASYLADWPHPIINRPEHIRELSRDGAYARLKDTPGIAMPATVRIERPTLAALAQGAIALSAVLGDDNFPIIIRPVGSHAGRHLEKIERAADLQAYLDNTVGEHFYMSHFVDYRSGDGLFRKYRIAIIDGKSFICHFAVSEHWMIHYLNAGMTESAEKRAEEAACMATFDDNFALRHAAALQAINERLQLAYIGIDCGETASGELLIFEVDNSMVVHAMDPEDMFPYKIAAMHKVFAAFRLLLEKTRLMVAHR